MGMFGVTKVLNNLALVLFPLLSRAHLQFAYQFILYVSSTATSEHFIRACIVIIYILRCECAAYFCTLLSNNVNVVLMSLDY